MLYIVGQTNVTVKTDQKLLVLIFNPKPVHKLTTRIANPEKTTHKTEIFKVQTWKKGSASGSSFGLKNNSPPFAENNSETVNACHLC